MKRLRRDAFAENDTITCAEPIANLTAYSDSTNVTYSWSGPNGFTSDMKEIQVSDSGTYILTVTLDSLCSTMDTIFVPKADDVPELSLAGDTINCIQDSAVLIGSSSTVGSQLEWLGPNGFTSQMNTIAVKDSGTYTLKITGPNGCVAEKSFTVEKDTVSRFVELLGDTLDCNNDSVSITALLQVRNKRKVPSPLMLLCPSLRIRVLIYCQRLHPMAANLWIQFRLSEILRYRLYLEP